MTAHQSSWERQEYSSHCYWRLKRSSANGSKSIAAGMIDRVSGKRGADAASAVACRGDRSRDSVVEVVVDTDPFLGELRAHGRAMSLATAAEN